MSKTIQTKRCPKCKQIKPISEFYKNRNRHDGLRGICKNCEKQYAQNEKGKAASYRKLKKYRQTDRGKIAHRIENKKHYETEKGKITYRKAQKRFAARHPNQIKAKNAVNNAIRDGRLPRLNTLQCHYYLQNPDCEKQAKQYHHHKGYALEHWFDVVPVCVPCHNNLPCFTDSGSSS